MFASAAKIEGRSLCSSDDTNPTRKGTVAFQNLVLGSDFDRVLKFGLRRASQMIEENIS